MKRLIATYPILYLATQYAIGDEILASNPKMVEAWLSAGTAEWREDETLEEGLKESLEEGDKETVQTATEDEGEKTPPAFAMLVSNEAGLEGDAVNAETPESLVGKVSKTLARSRK